MTWRKTQCIASPPYSIQGFCLASMRENIIKPSKKIVVTVISSDLFILTVPDNQSFPHCFCDKDWFPKLEHLYRGHSETGAAGGVQRRGRGTSGGTTCQKTSEGTSWQQFGLFDELANEQESTLLSHLGETTIARGRPPIAALRG